MFLLSSALFPGVVESAPGSETGDETAALITVELYADNLPKPVAMAFDPDGNFYFIEDGGYLEGRIYRVVFP